MSNYLIEAEDLGVHYGSQVVLQGIDLNVADGEFVSIVGKSGCGKSSLLLALAGFVEATGRIEIPEKIGMIFQNYTVFPWLTVRGNVSFGLDHYDATRKEERVARNLALVELTDQADIYPQELSGGQTQRVAIARTFAPDPQVVFMDEPFGALDVFTRGKMQEWMEVMREKERKTILFVTHSIEEAIFLSDRIVIIRGDGTCDSMIVPLERPRKLKVKYSSQFVDLRRDIMKRIDS